MVITGKKLVEVLKEHFRDFRIDGEKAENLISFDEYLAHHIKEGGDLIRAGIIPPYTLYFLPEKLKIEAKSKIDLNLWVFLSGFLMRVDHFASFCEEENKSFLIEIEIFKTNLAEELNKKFKENFWQKEFMDLKNENIILIAPTGLGKTEFAFLWAEGEKFFYTLPLRVATNQMFERACSYFNEKIAPGDDFFINRNVGLLHSDADLYIFDKWENARSTDKEGEIPKIVNLARHFSLPVNISTGDLLFPSALKYPVYERIYATLGYSKLIIDEVQAYDPRACAIVVKMIEDIVSLGGKFLLMTATLPEFVREELKAIKFQEINLYEKVKDITRHKVELREKDIENDIEEVINKANEGKRVLVVLNTVEKAEEVYKAINKKIKEKGFDELSLELLHSRFTLNERKEKERELEGKFKNPKPSDENSPKILVATQVVEASLDIDADYLFTEIAPIDSLIQRMGRIMRRIDLMSGKIKGKDEKFKWDNFYKKNESNIIIYFYHKENSKEFLESGKEKVDDSKKQKEFEKEYNKELDKILENVKNNESIIIELKESEKNSMLKKFMTL